MPLLMRSSYKILIEKWLERAWLCPTSQVFIQNPCWKVGCRDMVTSCSLTLHTKFSLVEGTTTCCFLDLHTKSSLEVASGGMVMLYYLVLHTKSTLTVAYWRHDYSLLLEPSYKTFKGRQFQRRLFRGVVMSYSSNL